MISSANFDEIFRELLPDGDVVLEDESSIEFSFPIGSKKLSGWAFMMGGEDIVIQIYCTGGTEPEQLNAVRILLAELNFRIPFGSYQTNELGVVTYRTQCFVETVEHAKFAVNKALQYVDVFVEDHLTGIAAVSEGFTTPEAAIQLIDAKTGAQMEVASSPVESSTR